MSNLKAVKMKAEGLNLFYGNFHALKNINLEIEEKAVTAIIGPSGCGKSTFLRTLNRMNEVVAETQIEGQVFLDDLNIFDKSVDIVKLRQRVGMVFQRPNPFPMSIYNNVAYGLRLQGIKDKKVLDRAVESSLKAAALWEEVKERLHISGLSLSGGQQQRLVLARVLAVEPEVILMDEPASALDPISTSKLEDLIEVLKTKYTIVIVTHNMQQAARVSDFAAFFLNGKLVELGATDQIFTNPARKETEDYITGRFG